VPLVAALAATWAGLVGAAIGSFLNVVIARVPAGQSIVRPGSRCPKCREPIRWHDNLPIVSWVLLSGRCRSCGAPISVRYPLVEALVAGAALVAYSRHGLSGAWGAELAFAAALLALAFIDLDTWLLPNAITWPLIACGLGASALGISPAGGLRLAAYGAGLGFALFAAVSWLGEKAFKKEALGFGDVWLLAGIGAWMGPGALLPVVLLASVQGTIVGLALIALGKSQPGPQPPGEGAPAKATSASGTRDANTAAAPAVPTAGPASARADRAVSPDTASTAPDDDWVPPKHAVPFGPFLVAGALEWLWLGGPIVRLVPLLDLFR
jgi:leader peptidase (prepilin peptidase)/N-methyltransferase